MARPMTWQQTLTQMALWDLKVIEYPGWRDRGRDPEHGPFNNVRGVVIHHTGSDKGQGDDYLRFLAITGRASEGIPAPLCNTSTDMDGDLHLIAQGRANHAGEGSSQTGAHVLNEDYAGYSTELHPGPDDEFDGNAVYYGNEVRYDGGQPMTPKQYASAVRWAAAVCHFHGWSALSVIGHREHTRRKNDPGNCPMNKFRADVAALLKAGPPNKTGDLTVADAQDILAAIADLKADIYAGPRYQALQNSVNAVASAVGTVLPYLKSEDVADDAAVAALRKSLDDLKAALPKPAPVPPTT